MSKQVSYWTEFYKGLYDQNPIFRQVLGMCPTLAVTVSGPNGLAMGLATSFVLLFSGIVISSLKNLIPKQVRIAAYIVVIATFVTIVDIVMKAKFPEMSKDLGPFIPLIVVNCLILGRAEGFSSKNNITRSVLDGLGMGVGFTIGLTILGGIREILGSRTIFGLQVLPDAFEPWVIMILPAGAFLTLGLLFGLLNFVELKKKTKKIKEDQQRALAEIKKLTESSEEDLAVKEG
ncbi:MAG: electron transport complex subunit E [Ignavibacteriaceae bacterium]|nr:electron transport complex subunit E [Ignavibacteriaceae bacterium]